MTSICGKWTVIRPERRHVVHVF